MTTKEEQVRADIATKFGSIPKNVCTKQESAQAEAQAHILVSRFHAQESKHDGN